MTSDDPSSLDPRVCFAAERTLLAWVRTGLAMMGFGFVVARFGWLMRELGAVKTMEPSSSAVAMGSGIALVVLGVLTSAVGAFQYERNMRRLRTGRELSPSSSHTVTLVAVALAFVGIAMAAYLYAAGT